MAIHPVVVALDILCQLYSTKCMLHLVEQNYHLVKYLLLSTLPSPRSCIVTPSVAPGGMTTLIVRLVCILPRPPQYLQWSVIIFPSPPHLAQVDTCRTCQKEHIRNQKLGKIHSCNKNLLHKYIKQQIHMILHSKTSSILTLINPFLLPTLVQFNTKSRPNC